MGLPSVIPVDIQEGAWVQDTGLCSSASASRLLGNYLWVVKGNRRRTPQPSTVRLLGSPNWKGSKPKSEKILAAYWGS